MELKRNVGGPDRIARGVLGIWLVPVAFGALLAGKRLTAAIAALASAGLLFNAATQFCGCNAVLEIDTTTDEQVP